MSAGPVRLRDLPSARRAPIRYTIHRTSAGTASKTLGGFGINSAIVINERRRAHLACMLKSAGRNRSDA
jgi:hypothetical protein